MDERSKYIGLRAATMTLVLVYLYTLVEVIYKYFRTKDIFNVSWEIGLLVFIPFSILWFARKDESVMLPKTIFGEELPVELDIKSKKRRQRHYMMNSLGLSISFTLLTVIFTLLIEKNISEFVFLPQVNQTLNIIIAILIELVVGFIVFYIIIYFWKEHVIRKYNQQLEALEKNGNE